MPPATGSAELTTNQGQSGARDYKKKLSSSAEAESSLPKCSQRCSGKERHFGALPESSLIRTCINDTRQKCKAGCGSSHPKLTPWGTVSFGDHRDSCFCSNQEQEGHRRWFLQLVKDGHLKMANWWQQQEAHGWPSRTHTPTTDQLKWVFPPSVCTNSRSSCSLHRLHCLQVCPFTQELRTGGAWWWWEKWPISLSAVWKRRSVQSFLI